jgi:hypothetical protein
MAKARSIGGIYASLSLRDGGFKRGLKSASKELKDFGGRALRGAAVGVAALATGMTAAAIVGTKSTLKMVADLDDVSNQTGIAVADMMRLQMAYKVGGREASNTGKDIGRMQKAIVAASEGGADPFEELGLSAANLMAMDPAKQFETIGAAIMRIENPAKRTAKAMEIFGRGGMGLTTVFGGFDKAATALGRMPEIAERFVGAMGRADELISDVLPVKSQQFFTGFSAGIIGELLPALEKIDDYDFTDLGLSVGSYIATGFQGLLDGTIFTIISEKFSAAMIEAVGSFQGYFLSAIAAPISALIDTEIDPFKQLDKSYSQRFSENTSKFFEAGKGNLYSDFTQELRDDADMLWNELTERMKENSDAAAAKSKKGGGATSDGINTPIIIPKISPISPLEALSTVNDYQRRGLSLGGETNGVAKKMDEQIAIAKESNATLKKILFTKDGTLIWG